MSWTKVKKGQGRPLGREFSGRLVDWLTQRVLSLAQPAAAQAPLNPSLLFLWYSFCMTIRWNLLDLSQYFWPAVTVLGMRLKLVALDTVLLSLSRPCHHAPMSSTGSALRWGTALFLTHL